MLISKYIKQTCLVSFFLISFAAQSQVVIGGITANNGAMLQLEDAEKGLMIPRVSLKSTTDLTTVITPIAEGLWVYNTANASSGLTRVTPGYYYWTGLDWKKMFNEGYSVQFEQSAPARSADNNTIYTLQNLNQTIVAPYTGIYEIHVTGYIACPNSSTTTQDAIVTGSYMLEVDNVKVAESFVWSATKTVPSLFQALGKQTTIVHNVNLTEGQSYNFKVRVRQWDFENVAVGSLNTIVPGNYAFWGIPTTVYNGNNLPISNAQDAYLTITLLTQL